MMNFLPQMYGDELLYSILGRYKLMCGMVSKTAFVKDIYGSFKMLTSLFLPQYIELLVENFPPNSKITAEELIMNHTMFPFYTSFLSDNLSSHIFRMMADGSGKSIENVLGFTGGKVKPHSYLKYCPMCNQENIRGLGESFWSRLHQVPGVLYCPSHGVRLKSSPVLSTEKWADFWCADDEVCNVNIEADTYSERIKELNTAYINNVMFLMNGKYKSKELTDVVHFYVDQLRTKRLASLNGTIYVKDFVNEFVRFYPSDYLTLMQSDVDLNQKANWLRLFVRNNGKNRSPLRHLLVLQFLGVSAEEFFKSNLVMGKLAVRVNHAPSFNLEERREAWLKIIEDNPGLNRSQLKSIGKGLHTWIYKHDRDWYEEVTPRIRTRKKREPVIDWEVRDEECLAKAKRAVASILDREGKPIRVLPATIRSELGVRRWFDNEKLVKTQQFIKEATENIDAFRVRKIKWAIGELESMGVNVTVYKVQLFAGFGGSSKEMSQLIKEILEGGFIKE